MKKSSMTSLAISIQERNNAKVLYDRMEKCKEEAKNVLKLSASYVRPIQAGECIFRWRGSIQMWDLERENFSNIIPTSVAEESLAWELYEGNDWKWYLSSSF